MPTFTRRQILRMFAGALPITAISARPRSQDEEEQFCVHVFNLRNKLPELLTTRTDGIPGRSPSRKYFEVGLPELLVCTTPRRLLEIFPYYWPVLSEEYREMRSSISLQFQIPQITRFEDIVQLSAHLRMRPSSPQAKRSFVCVMLTLNEYTKYWCSQITKTAQEGGADELVIIKDPTRAPYFCDFPTHQRGFRRKPE